MNLDTLTNNATTHDHHHHHQTIHTHKRTGAAVPSTRVKRGLLTEDAERLLKQASTVDVNNVGQLADLVERNKAEECLTRVICELSNNPKSHGDQGTRFAQSLLKFRQSKHHKVKQYVDAMAYGAKSKNSEQCRAHYPRCNHSTVEVVSVGNKLLHRA